MRKLIDLKGQRFGRLMVLSRHESDRKGQSIWLCKCNCGNEIIVKGVNLRSGRTKSCGCLKKDILKQRNTKFGTSHGMAKTETYHIWLGMLNRCRNENNSSYQDYGGRGITVCKRWQDFRNFYADMGDRPKGLTIERVDNSSGYFPDNCRWDTRKSQANNMRSNVIIEHLGYSLNMTEWAKKIGINYWTLVHRIRKGWPIEEALTKPLMVNQWR